MKGDCSKILVTGGAGFIGSHIVNRLLNEGYEVNVIDNMSTGYPEKISHLDSKDLKITKGDIRDSDLVGKTMKDVDAVFHEAALVSPVLSVEDPLLTNDINVAGTLNLLKAASDLNVKRFIYASSAAVYGDTSQPQNRESMTPNPLSPYGVSKLAAEHYVTVFSRLYGLETSCLRYFNVYGPRQRLDPESAYSGVIVTFLSRLLEDKSLTIHGDGEQTRDFVYIEDIVQANMLALTSNNASGEIFNIGTGTQTTVNKLANTLKEITGKKNLENVHSKPRPGDIRYSYADIDKARRILNYNPKFSLKEGLIRLVEWYSKNHKRSKV